MKVLILHQHFNTPQQGGAIRSYYLARSLADSRISVTVIAGAKTKGRKQEMIEGIDVHYLPVAYDNRFGFFERIVSFLKYLAGVIRDNDIFHDVDICYVISTPLTTGLAGLWIKWRYKIPFIFEVGDLWPDAPIQLGYIKNYVLKRALFKLERLIYEQSASIVGLSPMIRSAIERKIQSKKISIITNMADVDFYRPEAKRGDLLNKYNINRKFVIAYIGTMGVANGLDYVLECARACKKTDLPIQFLLCGDGGMLNSLKQVAQQLSLHNLSFVAFQNRHGVREIMNVSDAVFVSYKPVQILETGSPNKYFDGLASGKLIIVNFGGWIREEIEKHQCGIFMDPKHPADIVEKIKPFLENDFLLHQFQRNSRSLAEEKYSRTIQGDAFVSLIMESVK